MIKSYRELTPYLGYFLRNEAFQQFISDAFEKVAPYKTSAESIRIKDVYQLELLFKSEDTICLETGLPLLNKKGKVMDAFHIRLSEKDTPVELPFGIQGVFNEEDRDAIRQKAGEPFMVMEGIYGRDQYCIDHFKLDHLKVSVSYNPVTFLFNLVTIALWEDVVLEETRPRAASSK